MALLSAGQLLMRPQSLRLSVSQRASRKDVVGRGPGVSSLIAGRIARVTHTASHHLMTFCTRLADVKLFRVYQPLLTSLAKSAAAAAAPPRIGKIVPRVLSPLYLHSAFSLDLFAAVRQWPPDRNRWVYFGHFACVESDGNTNKTTKIS